MKWLKNLKVQNKLFLAFGAFILLMLVFVLFSAGQLINASTVYYYAVMRQSNITGASGTLAMLRFNNLTTAFSYYDDEMSQTVSSLSDVEYENLCNTFLGFLAENRDLVYNDPSLPNEYKQLRLALMYRVEFLFNDLFRPVFYSLREGAENKDPLMVARGLADSYGTSSEIAALLNDLHIFAVNVTANRSNSIGRIIISMFAVALLLMIISFIVSFFIGKMITVPIADMQKAMVAISGGNLTYPIRSEYRDELGVLSNRIGGMVDNISELNKSVAAIDYLDTMIYVTDLDYNLVYINQGLAARVKINRSECKMKKCYNVLAGRNFPCEICKLPDLAPQKESLPSIEYRDTWDNVLNMWTGGRASIIRWIDGNLVFYQTINDESEKKAYEENLQRAAREAQAASISKTTFLANMSHEIRTPMNSIIGFSELAMDDNISAKTKNYLDKIKINSELLLQIINDILDISKIEAGKMELEMIPFDLHELFIACQSIILPKAEEKGIILHFYAEPSIGKKLTGDPTKLRQVFLNILSNAVKFTNTGGFVKVSATVEKSSKDIITIIFEIKDSGIGMNSGQIEKISEPFTQAEAGTTRKYGGTGLGLAISKRIIEMMGSTLDVESTPGIGSKFSFKITFRTTESQHDSGEKNILAAMNEKPHFRGEILLCEDNEMNQQMLCDHLSRIGLEADIAENGREGLNMVKRRINKGQKPYDLIFMDIHMPIMDGIEASSKIREFSTGTPIIALTANVMTHDREQYLKNGMKDCLSKPFTSRELWQCLLKFLTPVKWETEGESAKEELDDKLLDRLKANFLKDNRDRYSQIVDAFSAGDIKTAHRLVHTLKGNAGILGRAKLRKAAEDIENMILDGKNSVPQENMDELKLELEALLNELESFIEKAGLIEDTAPIAPLDAEKAQELFGELLPLLEKGDYTCLKLIKKIRGINGSEELIQQMEDLDFLLAAQTLSKLFISPGIGEQ